MCGEHKPTVYVDQFGILHALSMHFCDLKGLVVLDCYNIAVELVGEMVAAFKRVLCEILKGRFAGAMV